MTSWALAAVALMLCTMPVSASNILSLPKDVRLHPEVLLVPLLGLMHLRVPLPSPVIGGGPCLDDGGVHDDSIPEPHPLGFQVGVDFFQRPLPKLLFFQEMTEV